MMGVVLMPMFAILPLLCIGIALVHNRQFYTLYKRIRLALVALLALAVMLFKIAVRVFS